MSFKDVRDLSEHLKLLGYEKVFPLLALSGSCGTLASFHIVAEILQWLAGLLEPGGVLSGGNETEEQRVLLIRSAVEFFVTKAAIKLNPRKLYASCAVTAAELQKITRILIAPTAGEDEDGEEENYRSLNQIDIGDKMDDLRRARELSADLTQRGVALHDLLFKEMENKEARLLQASRPMELASVERALKNGIAAAEVKLQTNRAQLENARVELNALNSKLQRKRAELERTRQRLEALQKIRPAHMQEFEECEKELQVLFQQYFLRLHVRDALRAQLEMRTKRATPVASPVAQAKPAENSMPLLPEGLLEDEDDEEAQLDGSVDEVLRRGPFGLDSEIPDIRDEDLMLRQAGLEIHDARSALTTTRRRPGSATSRIRPTTGRSRKPMTSTQLERAERQTMLNNRNNEHDDSSFGSSDSDLDMGGLLDINDTKTEIDLTNKLGAQKVDDDFDLNSIDDISISKLTGELPLRPKTANKQEHHSDEDF